MKRYKEGMYKKEISPEQKRCERVSARMIGEDVNFEMVFGGIFFDLGKKVCLCVCRVSAWRKKKYLEKQSVLRKKSKSACSA